jgi:hypothetical protein
MAFSVNEFAGALKNGGARSGLFQVVMTVPDNIGISNTDGVMEQMRLTAHAASIPSSTIEPTDVTYFGRTLRIPGSRTFEDWTTTVYIDESYKVRDFFEEWSEAIIGQESNTSKIDLGLGAEYTKDVEVSLFSKAGNQIRKYKLIQAWPTTIGATDLAWEGNDIQTFEVTWAYTHWETPSFSTRFGG